MMGAMIAGFVCGVLVAVLGWAVIEAKSVDNWKR